MKVACLIDQVRYNVICAAMNVFALLKHLLLMNSR